MLLKLSEKSLHCPSVFSHFLQRLTCDEIFNRKPGAHWDTSSINHYSLFVEKTRGILMRDYTIRGPTTNNPTASYSYLYSAYSSYVLMYHLAAYFNIIDSKQQAKKTKGL